MEQYQGTKPPSAAHAFDVAALQAYLQRALPGFAGPLAVEQFKGGQSNPTYKLITPAGSYVMRSKPGPVAKLLPSAHAIEREYRVMAALAGSGVPVPKMLLECGDESVIGRAFYLMELVEGRVLWEQSLPGMAREQRAAIYDEMNRVIATLHRLDVGALGCLLGEPQVDRPSMRRLMRDCVGERQVGSAAGLVRRCGRQSGRCGRGRFDSRGCGLDARRRDADGVELWQRDGPGRWDMWRRGGWFRPWRRCEGGPGREAAVLGLVRGRDGQHAHGVPEVGDDRGQRGDVFGHVLIRLALRARLLEQRRSQSGRVAFGCDPVGVRLVCRGQLGAVLGQDLAEQLRRASGVRLLLSAQLVTVLAEQLRGAGGLRLALGTSRRSTRVRARSEWAASPRSGASWAGRSAPEPRGPSRRRRGRPWFRRAAPRARPP